MCVCVCVCVCALFEFQNSKIFRLCRNTNERFFSQAKFVYFLMVPAVSTFVLIKSFLFEGIHEFQAQVTPL